jgi:hypothetical protein
MKRLTTLILSGVLFVAAPVATAPAQTGDQNQETKKDDSDFPYGLLGLLGLAGLAGLKKRKDDDHHREVRTVPTTGTTGTTPGDTGGATRTRL